MPLALAENPRTAKKAAIKRASRAARASMHRLDRQARAEVTALYQRARDDLAARIGQFAGQDGSLRLSVMQDLVGQVDQILVQMANTRNQALDEQLRQAATLGIEPLTGLEAGISTTLSQVADEAVRFVHQFVAADGLQLSDRIWRIDNHARQVVGDAIQSHIIQGHSASQAAQEFLAQGIAVPRDVAGKVGMAQAATVAQAAVRALMETEGSPYDNALRLFRTEINRAHGEAYMRGAEQHPDVLGFKYLLSPRHPRPDICDMHASVNRYGLGPGVYPSRAKTPWPAHPNTLSFVVVVFRDEVTAADRAGKQDRIAWLKAQPPGIQEGVLASRKKRIALEKGVLVENEIATPWSVLKKRYQRRGLDTDSWQVTPDVPPVVQPPAFQVPAGTKQARQWAGSFDQTPDDVLQAIQDWPPPEALPRERGSGAYFSPSSGGIMMGKGNKPGTPDGRRTWRHEYGHYLDWRNKAKTGGGVYASDSTEGLRALRSDNAAWRSRQRDAWRAMVDSAPALKEKFKGRRFSKRAYMEARMALLQDRIDAKGITSLPDAEKHFAGSDSLFAQAWRHATDEQKATISYRMNMLLAEEFDDLAFLAGNPPAGHESYINMADLAGAITKNRIGWGHSVGYYGSFKHRQAAEAFANAFDLMTYGENTFEADLLEAFAPEFSTFTKETLL